MHVLTGASLQALVERIMAAHNDPAQVGLHQEEYDYYPKEWVSPFIDRRRKVGWDLYSLLDITKGDKARMHEQNGRNFRFFDAPVGMIFTIDRVMGKGSLLDYGMFLENIMVAAPGSGAGHLPTGGLQRLSRAHFRASGPGCRTRDGGGGHGAGACGPAGDRKQPAVRSVYRCPISPHFGLDLTQIRPSFKGLHGGRGLGAPDKGVYDFVDVEGGIVKMSAPPSTTNLHVFPEDDL